MAPIQETKGREAVLEILKRDGPISADSAAEKLGLTAMAVRQHLYGLEAAGEAVRAGATDGQRLPYQLVGVYGRGYRRRRLLAELPQAFGDLDAATNIISLMKREFVVVP